MLILLLVVISLLMITRDVSYKRSSFECGFLSSSKSSRSASLQFLTLLFVFIVFDLEVVLVISFFFSRHVVLGLMVVYMLLGLLVEWSLRVTK